jgi:hypothetical protein
MLSKLKDFGRALLYGEPVKPWTEVFLSPDGKQSVHASIHRKKDEAEVVWLRFADYRFPGRSVNDIALFGLAPGSIHGWLAAALQVAESGSAAVAKLPLAIRIGLRLNNGIRAVKLLAELRESKKTVNFLYAGEDKRGETQLIYRRSSPADEDYHVFPLDGLRALEFRLAAWLRELGLQA